MAKALDELKELQNLNGAQLQAKLRELREKLRDLSFRTRADEIRDMHEFGNTRKSIARVLTMLNKKSKINPPSRKA